jgi:hypothetical protein
MAYSNALVGGDPVTPILTVTPGQPFRTHVTMPAGGSRGATWQLDGHIHPQEPYQSEKNDASGYPLKYAGIGSVRIGNNPLSRWSGTQESVLPAAHFNFVYPSAGGMNAIPGDYLYRDYAVFGNTGGMWGLLRVINQQSATTTTTTPPRRR